MTVSLHDTESLWAATAHMPSHPALAFNVRVDVAVIGGGVTGATTAYLLKQTGRTVALVERGRCGGGETGRSAAHVTALPRQGLARLVDRIGADRTRAVWDASFAALTRLRAIVRDERINCEYSWVPGLVYAPAGMATAAAKAALAREAAAAESFGIEATRIDEVPGLGRPGLAFEGQARLHPLRYVTVLVDRVPDAGSYVFEDTPIDAVEGDGPFVLWSGAYRIVADQLVVATHLPWAEALGERADLIAPALRTERTWIVSGVAEPGALTEGVYWEGGGRPREYLRVDRHPEHHEIVLGWTRVPDDTAEGPHEAHAALVRRLGELVPDVRVMYRWAGALVETSDGLPIIGAIAPGRFVATGYGLSGMTYGTLGGMMVADAIAGRSNAWHDLFGIDRLARVPPRPSVEGTPHTQDCAPAGSSAGAHGHPPTLSLA